MYTPPQMIAARRWMVRPSNDTSRANKQPYSIRTGQSDGWNLAESQSTYAEVLEYCETNIEEVEGLSFVLQPHGTDADLIWVCLDFDSAFGSDRTLYSWVQQIVDRFGSYVELSRSGRGLHIFLLVRSTPIKGMGKKNHPEGSSIEVIANSQIAVTGNVYGPPRDVAVIDATALEELPFFTLRAKSDSDATPEFDELVPEDIDRCLERVMSMPLSVEKAGGDKSLFDVACVIAKYGVGGEPAMEIIRAYNAERAHPPWDDERLAYKLSEGAKVVAADDEIGIYSLAASGLEVCDSEPLPMPKTTWTKSIDLNALDSCLLRYASGNDPMTEADINAVLLQMKQMAGCVIGRRAYVVIGPDRHYAKLNRIYVGPTAIGRKGTSYSIAVKPFQLADPNWYARIVKSFSSGEAIISRLRDPDPTEERDPMQTVNEDKRCYWFNPEYAEVMTHIKRDGSTAGMISRDSWDDTPLQRAVVDNNECYVASRTHIVSAGHITPREFIDELRPRDLYNGHCNRHEYYYTERRKVIDEEGWTEEQQETINSERQRLIDACANAIRDAMTWLDSMRPTDSTDGVEFRLDADARLEMQAFNKYYNDLLETSPLAHIFSRAIPIIKRNALVEAVLDRSTKITAKHVRAAIAEWHYGRESAEFIFASTTLSDEERIRRELVRTIESHGGRISARDLAKTSRKYRGAGVAHAALEALIKQRLGKWDVTKTPTKDRCEFVLFVNSENQS